MAWEDVAGMLIGVPAITFGVMALWTGWVLPRVRHRVTSPRLYGLGGLTAGAYALVPGLVHFGVLPRAHWETGFFGGPVLVFSAVLLVLASQMMPLRRGDDPVEPARESG